MGTGKYCIYAILLPVLGSGAASSFLRSTKHLSEEQAQLSFADETTRDLFFGDPLCDAIRQSFDHDVECKCDFSYIGGGIGYHCESSTEVCVDTTFETFCGTPKYEGSIAWHVARGTVDINATVCSDVKLTTSPLGNGRLEEVCVSPEFCVETIDNSTSVAVCSCEASYGGASCDTCQTCVTDQNELGIEVGCGTAVSPICMPFSLPFSAGVDVPVENSIRPFVPQLVLLE